MLPFFYPTSIAVVDDDQTFLESFSFYFGDEFNCYTFQYPEKALSQILDLEDVRQTSHAFYSDLKGALSEHPDHPADRLICWKASRIYELLQDPKRFQHMSLGIIDYDMPGMTGVELCRHINDLPMRKILLTGKTGMDTAVEAFNEGIIDCFLMKQDKNLPDKIRYEIKRLQKQYFTQITGPIKSANVISDINFLDQPEVEAEFYDLIRNKMIEEYYLSSQPPGMLLVKEDGTTLFMLIYNKEKIQSHILAARSKAAPEPLVQLLESGRVLCLFPTEDGYYGSEFQNDWNTYIWPCQEFSDDDSPWRYCVIDNASLKRFFHYDFFTYGSYKKLYGF